ncbi:MAG: hypothetical protein M1325_01255, partial [Actinobacteria bacterium]|nr:hypothetical protein [Actinomycetota bacterium]
TIPYLATAVAITPMLQTLARYKGATRWVSAGTGVLLAAFGLLMLSGEFTRLTEISSRLLPFRVPLGM